MNHEARIKQLEKTLEETVAKLEKILAKETVKWMPTQETCDHLQITKMVLYNRIKSGLLIKGKDFRKNGNRYLFNVSSVAKKIT